MEKTCKTCRYWEREWKNKEYGECDRINRDRTPKNLMFDIEEYADDDQGLCTSLKTGQDFFCAHWSTKREKR